MAHQCAMTTTLTAEKLAQRAVDVNVLTEHELNGVWAEFGTRAVDYEPFKQALVRRGLLTNYQLDRLIEGALDEDHLRERLWAAFDAGLRSVAIVFMHGYRYPAHEKAAAAR